MYNFYFCIAQIEIFPICSKTNNILNSHLKKRYIDWNLLRTEIKDVVGKYLYFKTKSNPIITPVVIDEELK